MKRLGKYRNSKVNEGDELLKQVEDLLEEGSELNFLSELELSQWEDVTPFKSWTVNQVVQHLHGSDVMAVMALKDEKVLTSTVQHGSSKQNNAT